MKPGVIELTGPTSLFSVIVEAGGPKPTAAYAKISRPIEQGPIQSPFAQTSFDQKYTTLQIPLNTFLSSDGENASFVVLPDDVITLPEMRPKMVYITGEVNKPGAIELATQDTVNLTKALAIAGGTNRTAKPSKTMIRHVNENGVETALAVVDVQKILSGKAKDVMLSDGDILIIPNNQFLSYLQLGTQNAITTSIFMLGKL
jgi:protein involved in polysaccharide export with SLBB domain